MAAMDVVQPLSRADPGSVLWLVLALSLPSLVRQARLLETLSMDSKEDCSRLIRNDDMSEGDRYRVQSTWSRGARSRQPQAECSLGFNFGDRYVMMNLYEWYCDDLAAPGEPFLAVYDTCDGRKDQLLAILNCTSPLPPMPVVSPSSCISLYHYRAFNPRLYYFSVEIIAEREVLAFSVGGVAAIVTSSVVVLMVLVKIVCVISGYERRLPNIQFIDPEEQRRILDRSVTEPLSVSNSQEEPVSPTESAPPSALARDRPTRRSILLSSEQGHHKILTVTRSTGSGSYASGAQEAASDVEYDVVDVVDMPSTPRLKRYPSAKASSIWRHK